jgi:hypothetical protein
VVVDVAQLSPLSFFFDKKKEGTRRCVYYPDLLKPDFDMAWGTSGLSPISFFDKYCHRYLEI